MGSRKKLSRSKSRRGFTRNAVRAHKSNYSTRTRRGGIRK